ncbi:unnamed protein product [Vitrella brassicaformis CCMP3155]|uniref:DUS-like FMN-binding domain-containing protein n=2 Tax=Vitrella brassicaformis TaxID=1169539 RepID=A0A0G4EJC3_VITBC|nr:unnamed protein product [Vitrella brassicaformis CCMP3155]|eukprot:CEL96844.1 unnamed protein product [Vitrella brassicaformis CCMP3155]
MDGESSWDVWRTSLGSPRYVCSPMVLQSEAAFRMMTRKYGVDLPCRPMVHSRIVLEYPNIMDRVMQLCGNSTAHFIETAKALKPFADMIDINLGCRQGSARTGGYGTFLLEDLPTVARMVEGCVCTRPSPCRLLPAGEDSSHCLEAADVAFVCLRDRTRFNTNCDWEATVRLKEIRVCGSSPMVASSRHQATSADAVRRSAEDASLLALDKQACSPADPARSPLAYAHHQLSMALEYLSFASRYHQEGQEFCDGHDDGSVLCRCWCALDRKGQTPAGIQHVVGVLAQRYDYSEDHMGQENPLGPSSWYRRFRQGREQSQRPRETSRGWATLPCVVVSVVTSVDVYVTKRVALSCVHDSDT